MERVIRLEREKPVAIPVKGYWDGTKSRMSEPCVLIINKGKYTVVAGTGEKPAMGGPVRLPGINGTGADSGAGAYPVSWLEESNLIPGLEDRYIIPGLVDCHVHLALDGIDFQLAIACWPEQERWVKQVQDRLEASAGQGITLVRDGGDRACIGLQAAQLSQAWQAGKDFSDIVFPEVVPVGEALRKEGCYGSFLGQGTGGGLETKILESGFARTPVGTLAGAVNRLKKLGARQLKVLVSGVVSFAFYGQVGRLQFGLPELKELVNRAHELELPVMAHVNSPAGITRAVEAGVDSIEHGYFMTARLLAKMAEKNIGWVPTVVPVANQVKFAGECYSPAQREVITRTYRQQLTMIKKAVELGVKLGVGTDAGAPGVKHGTDYHEELELYREAGLDNLTILKAAVCWGREIAGPGEKQAGAGFGQHTWLVLRHNPLNSLAALREDIKYIQF